MHKSVDTLKDDKDLVIASVQQDGGALKFASERLRGDKDVVMAAISSRPRKGWAYATVVLKNNRDFVLDLVSRDGSFLELVSDDFKADRSVVFSAVMQNGRALQHASATLQADRSVVIEAVKQYAQQSLETIKNETKP